MTKIQKFLNKILRKIGLIRIPHQCDNSFFEEDDDVDIDRFPRVYKFKLEPKNKTPLPLYRRGVRRNEWSAEPHRLNEHLGEKGLNLNNPADFLTAYYAGLANGFIPFEEKIMDNITNTMTNFYILAALVIIAIALVVLVAKKNN